MVVRRRVGLVGTVAAGLLVSAAALPAIAGTAPTWSTSSAPAGGPECTAARSAETAYRVGTIGPLAHEWGEVLAERQERYDALDGAAVQAWTDRDAAEEALRTAQRAEAEAEAALQEALTGGDAGEIEVAENALAAATDVRVLAGQTFLAASSALRDANDAVDAFSPVLAEARGTAMVLYYTANPVRPLDSEEVVVFQIEELQSLDDPEVVEYVGLLQDLADACFADADDADADVDEDEDDEVPPAVPASPVATPATYTG